VVVEPVAGRQLAQHLLRELTRTLAQLLQRPVLMLGSAVEIAVAQRALGALHRLFRAVELSGRLHAKLAHAALQPAEPLAQLSLAIAERAALVAFALTLFALLAALALAILFALLAKGVVKQALLLADDVAELVHHLAEALALALIGHAAGLQAIQQVAQLAQH